MFGKKKTYVLEQEGFEFTPEHTSEEEKTSEDFLENEYKSHLDKRFGWNYEEQFLSKKSKSIWHDSRKNDYKSLITPSYNNRVGYLSE